MKREIKFRAWDKTNNNMLTWEQIDSGDKDGIILLCEILTGKDKELIPMQYTGLLDRNGKEIYEGDIIKWGHLPDSKESEVRIATVRIDPDIQFDCKNISYPKVFHYGNFAYGGAQLEVIGNIYETPELIKGSKRVNS